MRRFLVLVLALGLLLRVVGLTSYPVGFTADEASFGYDAYSLIATGKDQWGASWPLAFRSFGDFKLPVYTYLTIPSVAIFGLNEFATRLPNAILGALAILAVYLMVKELFNNERLGLVSAGLLAISPWHITLSRGAFEANLTVFFMAFGVWAFLKGLKDKRFMTLSALSFGINLFTYHSARLITPIIGIVLVLMYQEELNLKKIENLGNVIKKYLIPFSIIVIFLAVAFWTLFIGGGARAGDVTIFNPTDKWVALSERRYEAMLEGMPSSVARIFSNKVVYVLDQFTSRYLGYLSPQFLFTEGVSGWDYGMIPGRGVLYIFEIPFILMSLWYIARNGFKKSKGLTFVLLWILLSPIAAALTKGPGYAGNRAATMMPALQVFSAFGAVLLFDLITKKAKIKPGYLATGFILVFGIFLTIFSEDYIYHASRAAAPAMLYGRREAVLEVSAREENYNEIFLSRSLTEPQIFVAFYTRWDPADYQEASVDWLRYEEENLPFLDQLGKYHLGKYTFKSLDYINDSKIPQVMIVGKPEDFSANVVPSKIINYPNASPALYLIDTASINMADKSI
jgi:4-amino-4-deoxy-L-arabinose transferase-like glycosyltransferase